jgi:hypothetical protein
MKLRTLKLVKNKNPRRRRHVKQITNTSSTSPRSVRIAERFLGPAVTVSVRSATSRHIKAQFERALPTADEFYLVAKW